MPRSIGLRHRFWLVLLLLLAGCSGGATRTPESTPSPVPSPQTIATSTPLVPGTPTARSATPVATPRQPSSTARPASPTAAAASPTPIADLRGAGMLVYLGRIEGKEGIVAVNADGTGLWLMAEGRYGYLLWAPDGSRFAAVTAPGPGGASQQVVVFTDGGRELGRHSFAGSIAAHLQWSPDSRRLLGATLVSDGSGPVMPPGVDAWILQDGAIQPIALPQDSVTCYFSWLPDGRILLASYPKSAIPAQSTDPGKLPDLLNNLHFSLWIANGEGQEARKVYEGPQTPFGVASSGAAVFGYSTRFIAADDSLIPELFSIDLDTGQARSVAKATDLAAAVFGANPAPTDATFSLFTDAGYNASIVSPKLDRLALTLGSGRAPQSSPTPPRMANEALVVLDSSGKLLFSERLPRDAELDGLAWSPDGTKLAYLQEDQLHVVDPAAGTDELAPLAGPIRDFSLSWSPDGRWIAFGGDLGLTVISSREFFRSYLLDPVGLAPAWQPAPQQKRLGGP